MLNLTGRQVVSVAVKSFIVFPLIDIAEDVVKSIIKLNNYSFMIVLIIKLIFFNLILFV